MFSAIIVTLFKNELSWIAWNCIVWGRYDFERTYIILTVMVLKLEFHD